MCLMCADKRMEKIHVVQPQTPIAAVPSSVINNNGDDAVASAPTSKPNPFTDCCAPSCQLKVCIPPIVAVCASCSNAADEKALVDLAQPVAHPEPSVAVPYKKCCDARCKLQVRCIGRVIAADLLAHACAPIVYLDLRALPAHLGRLLTARPRAQVPPFVAVCSQCPDDDVVSAMAA